MALQHELADDANKEAQIVVAVDRMFEGLECWTVDAWARDDEGNSIDLMTADDWDRGGSKDGTPSCWCLGGAIMVQCAAHLEIPVDHAGPVADLISRLYCEEAEIPPHGDGPQGWLKAIVDWNDDPERTYEEVWDLTGRMARFARFRLDALQDDEGPSEMEPGM